MENKTKIFKAIADFQNEVPVIHQNTKGYGYTYTNLTAIFKVIKPLLQKNGLGFTQLLDGENLKTIIFHIESEETLESSVHIQQDVSLAKMNTFQVLGSAITYYRRYSLSAALGLVTDADIDASGTQTPKAKPVLNPKSTKWDKAKEAVANGATFESLNKYYTITKENFDLLCG